MLIGGGEVRILIRFYLFKRFSWVGGAVTMIFILSTPADVPLFTFHFETSILLWFAKNSRPIAATALALAMTLSMLSIINNVQDIMRMQGKGASST